MAFFRTTRGKVVAVICEVVAGIVEIAIGTSTLSTVVGVTVIVAALAYAVWRLLLPELARRSARQL